MYLTSIEEFIRLKDDVEHKILKVSITSLLICSEFLQNKTQSLEGNISFIGKIISNAQPFMITMSVH